MLLQPRLSSAYLTITHVVKFLVIKFIYRLVQFIQKLSYASIRTQQRDHAGQMRMLARQPTRTHGHSPYKANVIERGKKMRHTARDREPLVSLNHVMNVTK